MAPRYLDEQSLDKYFDLIRDLPLLTAEEEWFNGRLWQRDRNPEGLKKLVEGNLRFVVKVAYKCRGMGLDLLDLISEGNLGLIEAAKRFDPERENRFLTYAVWWVRQSINHAMAEHGNKIRLPQKVAGHLSRLNRFTRQLEQVLGRVPDIQDLAAASSFTVEEVEQLQLVRQTISPVSTELGLGDSNLTLFDTIEQTTERSALDTLDQESFLNQLHLCLGSLKAKERRIIDLHFGLDGCEPETLDVIGKSLMPPLSRERVRQIEEGAFKKIRHLHRGLLGQFLQPGFATGS